MKPRIAVYKQTPEENLQMHVFEAGNPSCLIVFFMCGGWVDFDARKLYPECEFFAARGATSMVAEVRVIERHGTSPRECVVDGKSAIRWARQNADRFGVREDRIVASGGSASGHVSLCAAMLPGYDEKSEDQAVSSAPDLVAIFNPAVLPKVVGKTKQVLEERAERFGGIELMWRLSPSRVIRSGLPPVLIMHGDADDITPLEDSRGFADKLRAAGNEVQLVTYPGAGHGFFNYDPDGNPWYDQTMGEMERFLRSHAFLGG